MKMILVKPVRKLGQVGELITVKNGYGKNYLIPQKFAIRATKENIAHFSTIEEDLKLKNVEKEKEAHKIANLVNNRQIVFIMQSAAEGKLFGSVNANQIALKLSKLIDAKLNYTNVLLENPIKTIGKYEVSIALHPNVISTISVIIAKSDSEAEILKEAIIKNNSSDE
jgi:large subunit ribosomal protein L9